MAEEKGSSFLLKAPATGIVATVDAGTDLVTMALHGMAAGDPVFFTTTGVLPARSTGTFFERKVYYVGTVLTNTFSLHTTKANGVAGTNALNFTDTGSGVHTGQSLVVVAGMRSTSFTIGGEEVDVTNKDSSGWRELLAGAGTATMSVSASGVFQDDSNLIAARVAAIAKTLDTYSIVFESGDEYYGLYQILSVEQGGEHNGEVTYNISIESSGAITLITNT